MNTNILIFQTIVRVARSKEEDQSIEITFPEGKQPQSMVESIFRTIMIGFLGRKPIHSASASSAFVTPFPASRLAQSTEHLCDGVFNAEAVFFAED